MQWVLSAAHNGSFRAVTLRISQKIEPARSQQGYWFAFHPHQKEALDGAQQGFAAFGCGSPANTFLIPIKTFAAWLDGMNMTVKEDRSYWNVQIYEDDGKPSLVRKKGTPRIDLAQYRLAD